MFLPNIYYYHSDRNFWFWVYVNNLTIFIEKMLLHVSHAKMQLNSFKLLKFLIWMIAGKQCPTMQP
jgi:hypothetical protein